MTKKIYERLISISVVEERDDEVEESGPFFWRWTYPRMQVGVRQFIEKRLSSQHSLSTSSTSASLDSDGICTHAIFTFYKFEKTWIYIYSCVSDAISLILLTCDFCPTSYKELLGIFTQLYQKTSSTKQLLHYYLTLIIHDEIIIGELENRAYSVCITENEEYGEKLKSIIKLFHLDVILIYTALLLKRRIAVYHHNQETLLNFATALPAFVAHRTECKHTVLVPNVDLYSKEQMTDLQARKHYVATFQDSRVEEHQELYDIYVNLAAVEITISHNARDVFAMTKTHKDVAMCLVRASENADSKIIEEISQKTQELRNFLFSIASSNETAESKIDLSIFSKNQGFKINKEQLKHKELAPNLELFYWNFAVAEGFALSDDS